MARDLTLLHFAPERLVRLGREGYRSTRAEASKAALSIAMSHTVATGSNSVRRIWSKRAKYAILT